MMQMECSLLGVKKVIYWGGLSVQRGDEDLLLMLVLYPQLAREQERIINCSTHRTRQLLTQRTTATSFGPVLCKKEQLSADISGSDLQFFKSSFNFFFCLICCGFPDTVEGHMCPMGCSLPTPGWRVNRWVTALKGRWVNGWVTSWKRCRVNE